MKKTILLFYLICFSLSPILAKDLGNLFQKRPDFIDDNLHRLMNEKNFENNQTKIYNATSDLTTEQRKQLYKTYKISAWNGVEGNFSFIFPKLGGGSLNQGDLGGAAVLFGTGLAGYAAFTVGALTALSPMIAAIPVFGALVLYANKDSLQGFIRTGLIIGGVGITVLMVDAVIAIVRPIVYAKRQNSALMSALRLVDNSAEISMVSLFNPMAKEFTLAAHIKL